MAHLLYIATILLAVCEMASAQETAQPMAVEFPTDVQETLGRMAKTLESVETNRKELEVQIVSLRGASGPHWKCFFMPWSKKAKAEHFAKMYVQVELVDRIIDIRQTLIRTMAMQQKSALLKVQLWAYQGPEDGRMERLDKASKMVSQLDILFKNARDRASTAPKNLAELEKVLDKALKVHEKTFPMPAEKPAKPRLQEEIPNPRPIPV